MRLEVETFENFDFRKNIYVVHKFNPEIDNIDELKNFYNLHKYELFDNCGLSFILKDYFDLDKEEDSSYNDNQKVDGIFFNVNINLPNKNNNLDFALDDKGRSWITIYRDKENSKYDCCHCLASISWAIKTIETFSDEERNDNFIQYTNRLKLFKATYEYIDNVFLKNGNNVLGINRNSYNSASKYIDDEIKKIESKQNKIKELIDKYGLSD
jgi:hypothetical protein